MCSAAVFVGNTFSARKSCQYLDCVFGIGGVVAPQAALKWMLHEGMYKLLRWVLKEEMLDLYL